jgi:hypothetical protein
MWRHVGVVKTYVTNELVASISTVQNYFHPKNEGDIFLLNAGSNKNHTAPQHKRTAFFTAISLRTSNHTNIKPLIHPMPGLVSQSDKVVVRPALEGQSSPGAKPFEAHDQRLILSTEPLLYSS